MTDKPEWSHAERILCIRLDSVGDVLMTTPAIRALKETRPERRITLLTSLAGAAVATLVPDVDEVLVYDAPWMKSTAPRRDAHTDFLMVEQLRIREFDAAIIFTVYSQNPLSSAFLCYLAGIPLRLAHCHENPYQLLSDWVPDLEPERFIRHEVRRQLDLVAVVGSATADERISLRVPQESRKQAEAILDALGIDRGQPWAILHPGASAPSRRYPPDLFAQVARLLAGWAGWPVVFTGDAFEVELIETVRELMGLPSHSLAGRLSLVELAAVIQMAPLLVANNTGPVHMAAGLGTPVVDLYALTNPQHTPWAVPNRVLSHDVPCKYCYKSICPEGHHDCLRRVAPEEVAAAVCSLMEEVGL